MVGSTIDRRRRFFFNESVSGRATHTDMRSKNPVVAMCEPDPGAKRYYVRETRFYDMCRDRYIPDGCHLRLENVLKER
jgi:hypothetical protein